MAILCGQGARAEVARKERKERKTPKTSEELGMRNVMTF
jgi:hypothetical protein